MDLSKFSVTSSQTIRDVMLLIDQNQQGIALLVDDSNRLTATLTDGDLRRAILQGIALSAPITQMLPLRSHSPFTAPRGTAPSLLIHLMTENSLRQIPIVDEEGRPCDIVFLSQLVKEMDSPPAAVVMAGGFGVRLRPLTEDLPKPMLPVGDRPLLEHIVSQLRDAGIEKLNITTHFKPEKIQDHFGDGKRFGIEIEYIAEETPLGTAGALGLLEPPNATVLVMNGDVLTKVDFTSMRRFHSENRSDLTVGVRQYGVQVPYGVIECEGVHVRGLKEKPLINFFVNAGVYLLEPGVFSFIPREKRIDMTELIELLLAAGKTVCSYPIIEYWVDIGEVGDYQRAREDFAASEADKA